MENVLSDGELIALKQFNCICRDAKCSYDKTSTGLINVWITVLMIFHNKFGREVSRSLLSALIKRTPHWEGEFKKGSTTFDKLIYYFIKCSRSLESFAPNTSYGSSLRKWS